MIKYSHLTFYCLLLLSLSLLSCNRDKPNPIPIGDIPEADGYYIYGSNTIAVKATDPEARMTEALLDPSKSGGNTEKEGVLGRLIYVGANSTLTIAQVDGDTYTVYGLPNGGELKPGFDISSTNIRSDMIQGTLMADEEAIMISNEGLYYVFILEERNEIRILQLQPEIIGEATAEVESTGIQIPLKSINADSAVYEISELQLAGSSGYNYRFARGWELYNGPLTVTFTYLGVESYEVSRGLGYNDIGYYNEECAQVVDGKYTLRLSYHMKTGSWTETKIFTGELPVDYSSLTMSIFGNAYLIAPGDTANWRSGTDAYEAKTPSKDGNIYTWSWTSVNLIQGRQFIFLENGEWGGLELNYASASIVGGQAVEEGKIVDSATLGSDLNDFYVQSKGTYDLKLIIDSDSKSTTVLINDSP